MKYQRNTSVYVRQK